MKAVKPRSSGRELFSTRSGGMDHIHTLKCRSDLHRTSRLQIRSANREIPVPELTSAEDDARYCGVILLALRATKASGLLGGDTRGRHLISFLRIASSSGTMMSRTWIFALDSSKPKNKPLDGCGWRFENPNKNSFLFFSKPLLDLVDQLTPKPYKRSKP